MLMSLICFHRWPTWVIWTCHGWSTSFEKSACSFPNEHDIVAVIDAVIDHFRQFIVNLPQHGDMGRIAIHPYIFSYLFIYLHFIVRSETTLCSNIALYMYVFHV